MKRSLNLMSARAHQRNVIRKCIGFWSRLLLGLLVVLTGLGIAKWRICDAEAQKQASAEQEYEPSRQMKTEAARLRQQLELLRNSERVTLVLAKQEPLLSLIGLASSSLGEHQEEIHLLEVSCERETFPGKNLNSPQLHFVLEGTSREELPVDEVVKTLESHRLFSSVKLSRQSQVAVSEANPHLFSIECTR